MTFPERALSGMTLIPDFMKFKWKYARNCHYFSDFGKGMSQIPARISDTNCDIVNEN